MNEEKQVQVVIKVPESLRDTFLKVCKDMDTTGSKELRDHMRKFIAKHGQGRLF